MEDQIVEANFHPASFRDPEGRVVIDNGQVLRRLNAKAAAFFDNLLADGRLNDLTGQGLLIPTEAHQFDSPHEDFVREGLRHETVAPLSYPWEWSFEMRRSAALTTLKLLQASLAHGLILKDGTAMNLAYHRGRMVWLDALSLMPAPERGFWVGYNQFCQTQLFPLLVEAYTELDPRALLQVRPDGIEADQAHAIIGGGKFWKRGVFKYITLPTLLERHLNAEKISKSAKSQESEEPSPSLMKRGITPAGIQSIAGGLQKLVSHLRAPRAQSIWSDYETNTLYSDTQGAEKKALVEETVRKFKPSRLLDLGCNAGEYSIAAAPFVDQVIAVDADRAAIDRLVTRNTDEISKAKIVPLVGDLVAPAMGHGWRGAESLPFLERIRSDMFICLALVHHLCIGKNLPIGEVVDLLADLAPLGLVEWIDKSDPMVRYMLRNREDIFDGYTEERFKEALENRFKNVQRIDLQIDTRRLYRVAERR